MLDLLELVEENSYIIAIVTAAIFGIFGTGIFTFLRRSKPTNEKENSYFSQDQLLATPNRRPAYSDRMAYVLAEMSSLAYYKFEDADKYIDSAAKRIVANELNLNNEDAVRGFLEEFSADLIGKRHLNTSGFRDVLKKAGFELLDTINVADTQGFACKRIASDEEPYVVIAFRGTESKIDDWLTDVRAVPTQDGVTKVHSGFLKALITNTGDDRKTALERVEEILTNPETKDDYNEPLRVFVTGHSLGGALALLSTKLLASDINGACYTFGAPRIANYEFFEQVKTPVYRIVNSSDIVPRVPPGALLVLLLMLVRMLSWLTRWIPVVPVLLDNLEGFLDKLNGYRHFGDLRFLTDVATGRFQEVKLLRNPPAIDRVLWFWKRLKYSVSTPVQSHSMNLYRKKLLAIACSRNCKVSK